jgi:hypothetical protein
VVDRNEDSRSRDPLEEGEDKAQNMETSRSREESMNETGKDAFGDKSAARNPDSTYIGRIGEQRSSTSGTAPLGGESRDADSKTGAGGVEGERDNR